MKDRIALPLTRRRFLELVAASAAMTAAGCDFRRTIAAYPFTLGVASGDPLPDRVVLWTRLAPEPLAPDGGGGMAPDPFTVFWEVANDEGFTSLVRAGAAVADPSLAHSVHVDVNGLAPDRWYFYRFHADGYVSPVGRTRTMPARDAAPALLRFAAASCQNYTDGFYTAHAGIAAEDLDFVTFLGDYIYEGGTPADAVRPHDGPRIADLAGYRNRYALYKSDANLIAAHHAFPWISTWDDHEVSNNYAGLLADENATTPPPIPFATLRAYAYQAWYEHTPVRVLPPKGSSLRIYRDFRFGDLASMFVLDTRQYRDDQPCGDSLKPLCPGFPDPNAQMLGAAQEAWLFDGITASQSLWNVLAQQVVFSPTPIGNSLNFDQWDGYPAARQRIVDFLRAREQRDTVILTGDIHASGAGWVPGLTPGLPATYSDPVATEFVSTSIASTTFDEGTASLIELLFQSYPHIRYFEALSRGYLRHEITRGEWRADYRFVDTVLEEVGEVSTAASFVVELGNPDPQEA
jgi:alkaline phosphatase D